MLKANYLKDLVNYLNNYLALILPFKDIHFILY